MAGRDPRAETHWREQSELPSGGPEEREALEFMGYKTAGLESRVPALPQPACSQVGGVWEPFAFSDFLPPKVPESVGLRGTHSGVWVGIWILTSTVIYIELLSIPAARVNS